MKLLVFSDVHGNLPALETMLKKAGKVDGYISLGDVVNYGPWSNECVDLIATLPNAVLLQGNHERYFLSGNYDCTNKIAQAFFKFCYPSFKRQDKIKTYRPTYKLNGFTFTHTIKDEQYVYPDSSIVLDKNYVIGHSHHQFEISQPPFILYNPGSVGQNRKHINVINYMTLETDGMKFSKHAAAYNVDTVIDEMQRLGYPAICIKYYKQKQRA